MRQILQFGFSFLFVLGLMWFLARMLKGKMVARGAGVLEVLARQQVGRSASVAIVRVADRALVLGVTEHGISILGDPISDMSTLVEPTEEATVIPGTPGIVGSRRISEHMPAALPAGTKNGALNGSVLSPATWRQALHVLRERTVRR